MTNDAAERTTVAARAAEAGGDVAFETFRDGLDVKTKSGKTDYVTQADHDAQARVVDVLNQAYPDEPVIGEESGISSTLPEDGPAWVVDPIDGSNNYVRGLPTWTTSVAAVSDGEPIASATRFPVFDVTYAAGIDGTKRNDDSVSVSDLSDPERCTVVPTIWWPMDRRDEYAMAVSGIVRRFGDMRRLGSVQAVLAYIASGALDGGLTNVVANPWDTLAGVNLVRQAGGKVTDVHGDRWHNGATGLVVSNGAVHEELLAITGEI